MELYHARDFEAARAKFLEVAKILPDYKKVKTYLSHINDDIRAFKKEQEQARFVKVEATYQEALIAFKNDQLSDAAQKFGMVEQMYPDYKAVRKNIEKIKEETAKRAAQPPTEATALSGASAVPAVSSQAPAVSASLVKEETPASPEDRALALYKAAVSLYKDKKYDEAGAKFEEVERLEPNYRSTKKYLEVINLEPSEKTSVIKEAAATPQVLTENSPQKSPEPVTVTHEAAVAKPAEKMEVKASKMPATDTGYAQLVGKAEPVYLEGIRLFKEGKYAEAKVKFTEARIIIPDYKSSAQYLALIEKSRNGSVTPQAAVTMDRDAAAIKELAGRSEALYRQIKMLSEDKEVASTARTFAQVDRIIANLEAEQRRLADDIERRAQKERVAAERAQALQKKMAIVDQKKSEEQKEQLRKEDLEKKARDSKAHEVEIKEKRLREDHEREMMLKARQKELEDKAERIYQTVLTTYRAKNYPEAKKNLEDLGKLIPHYKDSDRLSGKIEREEGEAALVQSETKDRTDIAKLAEQANAMNLEVLSLSQQHNYEAINRKFNDLEGVLTQIKGVKERMMTRRNEWTAKWEGRARSQVQKRSYPVRTADVFKSEFDGRTVKGQARMLFNDGQQLYSAEKFPEARVKFLEAQKLDPSLIAAATYVRRIDRVLADKDFENQKARDKAETRNFEKKEETKEGVTAETDDAKKLNVEDRAKLLMTDGTSLYKAKRYREARIKFEELSQIGDEKQANYAKRYLKLIEKEIENERVKAAKEKEDEEARYLRERRERDHMGLDQSIKAGGKPIALPAARPEQDARELEIKRQQELRMIEKENMQEREKMIVADKVQEKSAAKETKIERKKYQALGQKTHAVIEERELPSASASKPEAAPKAVEPRKEELKKEEPKKEEAEKEEKPDPLKIQADREKARQQALQKKRMDKERARLLAEEKRRRQAIDQEKARILREKAKIEKTTAEQDRARKTNQEKAIVNYRARKELLSSEKNVSAQAVMPVPSVPVVSPKPVVAAPVAPSSIVPPAVTPVPPPELPKPVAAQVKDVTKVSDKAAVLKASVEEEKHLLAQQREAIRHDFEVGVERLYSDAVALFKKRQYEEAGQDFQQVNDLIPGYKKTGDYLRQINKTTEKKTVDVLQPPPPAVDQNRARSILEALDTYDTSAKK
ncbi:MAG: hypothetical protein HQL16_06140 [Candidatus Omnitrophica bacterium]|nr:hypothetical protein [Candidatus Omnitrophota bacterium]